MIRRNILFFIALLFLNAMFYSCVTSNKSFQNREFVYNPIYGVYKSIYMDSNGRFLFYNKEGLNSDSVFGKWNLIDKDLIYLNYNHTNKSSYSLTVLDNKKEETGILVEDWHQNELGQAIIVINDSIKTVSNPLGYAVIESNVKINNIAIRFLGKTTHIYDVPPLKKNNLVKITLKEHSNFNYDKDTVIKVKNKKLIFQGKEFYFKSKK